MKEYKYGNVTVRVHGKPDQEKLKKAVEEFAKSNYEYLYPEQKEKGWLGPNPWFMFSHQLFIPFLDLCEILKRNPTF